MPLSMTRPGRVDVNMVFSKCGYFRAQHMVKLKEITVLTSTHCKSDWPNLKRFVSFSKNFTKHLKLLNKCHLDELR